MVSNVPCALGGFLKGHISCYWEGLFLYLGKKNSQGGSCTFEFQLSRFFSSPEQGKSAGVWLSSCLRNEAVLSLGNGPGEPNKSLFCPLCTPGLTSGICSVSETGRKKGT